MSQIPTVAIIGRPNTGKSTLFNRLLGRRQAIVSDRPGTTRDHVAGIVDDAEIPYELLDTGGMGGGTVDKDFEKDVHAQSLLALEHADVILLTINAREELTGSDREIIGTLRKRKRRHVPVITVLTKCDTEKMLETSEHAYHDLGIGEALLPVSAEHNIGIGELEAEIEKQLQKLKFKKITQSSKLPSSGLRTGSARSSRVAILGQPNTGKSSLINALMAEPDRKRSPRLVSDIPGTTRDTTDTVIRHEGKEYIFVDTAGLRKSATMRAEDLERLAVLRTERALEFCDVVVLLIDGIREVNRQDKRLARMITDAGKGLIIALNKADLLKGTTRDEKLAEVSLELRFCRFAPLLPCSAVTREGLLKLFPLIEVIRSNRSRELGETELRAFLEETLSRAPLGGLRTCRAMRQVGNDPPTFHLTVRNPKEVRVSELKHIERRMRETFAFEGTPIRFVTKKKTS